MVTVSSCEHLASRSDSSSEHLCADSTAESVRVTADDLIFVHPSQKDAETGPIVVVEIDSNEVEPVTPNHICNQMQEHTHGTIIALPHSVDMVATALKARPVCQMLDERTDDGFELGPYKCWDSSLLESLRFIQKEHVCDPRVSDPFATMLDGLKVECSRSPYPFHIIDNIIALFKYIEVVVYVDFSGRHPDLCAFEEPRWSVSIMRFLLWWLDSLTKSGLEEEERRAGRGTRFACRIALVMHEMYRFIAYCKHAYVAAGDEIRDGGDRATLRKARYPVRGFFLEDDGTRIFRERHEIAMNAPYPHALKTVIDLIMAMSS